MRHLFKSLVLSSSLLLVVPSAAHAIGFESTVEAPLTTAVKLEISLSEDLAKRANELPEKLSDRGGGTGRSSGFSQNGFYGERELEQLQARLEERLLKQLDKRGIEVSETAPTVLRVTLVNVKNNRPTFEQLSREPGLSLQSFGIGGAELEAEVLAAGGNSLGTMTYDWYEQDFRDAQFTGTWTDANRAIDRFAKRAAKDLTRESHS